MKKITLALSALAFLTTAGNAELLLGIEYPGVSNMSGTQDVTYDPSNYYSGGSTDYDFSYQPFMIKIGTGTPEQTYVYLYYQSTEVEYDNGGTDSEPTNEFGLELVSNFETSIPHLHPNLLLGAGIMTTDINTYSDGAYSKETQGGLALKIGTGLSYYLIPQVELVIGLNYNLRAWFPIEESRSIYNGSYTETVTRTTNNLEHGFNVTFGVNVWPFATGAGASSANSSNSSYEESSTPTPAQDSYENTETPSDEEVF